MRRILMVLTAAALMASMVMASALPAFADKGGVPGHCKEEGTFLVVETCAGGGPSSEGPGGGGGREADFSIVFGPIEIPLGSCTTGGSGGPGGGGGGNTCPTPPFRGI